MDSMIFIFTILQLLTATSQLKIAQYFSYVARYGYHSTSQIHNEASTINNVYFHYKRCDEDAQYRYAEVNPPNASLKAVIICNIHARELISSQICLHWLQQYSSTSFFKKYKITIFLVANKNRQKYIENEASCVRKNQNGVDLNRNFPTDFNHLNLGQDSDLYSGSQPINQPFTICLDRLLIKQNPEVLIDFHSGMSNRVFYQQGINNKREIQVLQQIKKWIIPELTITTLKLDNQTINGHIFADLKVRKQLKYSFLFETFFAWNRVCFYMFNPVGEQKVRVIEQYVRVINKVLFTVAQLEIQ